MKQLFIFDWNGTLQDDMHHIYECGVQRIFRHFRLPCPDLDTYRNQVTADFMSSFYWPNGIPKEVTAEDLDLIMRGGFEEKGTPPDLFPGAKELIARLHQDGRYLSVVSAYDDEKLGEAIRRHGLQEMLGTPHGSVRQKAPVFRRLMEELCCRPDETVCVGDTVGDAEAAIQVGALAVIIPEGFHAKERFLSVEGPIVFCDSLLDVLKLAE